MISRALLQPSVVPKLVYRVQRGRRSIEVWLTTCIVHPVFPKSTHCTVLINPSNPTLTGVSKFPYFPKGGPVPSRPVETMHKDWQPLGHVSYWGSMSTGDGILFPISVVDGLVHQLGGWRLQLECQWKRLLAMARTMHYSSNTAQASSAPCPVGQAVVTSGGGPNLAYCQIVHTTPPFYQHDEHPRESLSSCYQNALQLAFAIPIPIPNKADAQRKLLVSCPLLGAGARGFPQNIAIEIASKESIQWCFSSPEQNDANADVAMPEEALVFGLLDRSVADQLAESIEQLSAS